MGARSEIVLEAMDLQLFAEQDIKNQTSNSLKRGIRSYRKVIAKHEDKIQHPEQYDKGWQGKNDKQRAGLLRHWGKEIRNAEQSIADRIEELKNRGDYDGGDE